MARKTLCMQEQGHVKEHSRRGNKPNMSQGSEQSNRGGKQESPETNPGWTGFGSSQQVEILPPPLFLQLSPVSELLYELTYSGNALRVIGNP